jgi:hypothetical protein
MVTSANAVADATKLASNSRLSVYDHPPPPRDVTRDYGRREGRVPGWRDGGDGGIDGVMGQEERLTGPQVPTRIVASPLESWIGGVGGSLSGGWGGAGMFVEGEGRRRMLESLLFGGAEIARERENRAREASKHTAVGDTAEAHRPWPPPAIPAPLGARAVQMTIKLGLDYEYAGKEGSGQRALFLQNICQDLARASTVSWIPSSTTTSAMAPLQTQAGGLSPANFQVQRVAIGSAPRTTLVDLFVHSDPSDHFRGQDAASVAGSLELQARDASSLLKTGSITRHIQSVALYGMGSGGAEVSAPASWPRARSPLGRGDTGGRGSELAADMARVELNLDEDFHAVIGKSAMQAAARRVSLARSLVFF